MKPLGVKMLETTSGSVIAAAASAAGAGPAPVSDEPGDVSEPPPTEASRSSDPAELPGPETLLEHPPTNENHAAASSSFDLIM
jgi:hypothetical protein